MKSLAIIAIFLLTIVLSISGSASMFEFWKHADIPGIEEKPPKIVTWSNSKTNDDALTFSVNTGDIVRFNVTSDQPITAWLWIMNGHSSKVNSETQTYSFDDQGMLSVSVNGSNINGHTQTLTWHISVQDKNPEKKRATILSWYPQVIDTIYIDNTQSRSIEYSVTMSRGMMMNSWTLDGSPVVGVTSGNTSSYTQIWDGKNTGLHTMIFKGSDSDSQIEFRWYVNVNNIEGNGGSIFDILDNGLEDHITEIRIRLFEYHVSKNEDTEELIAKKLESMKEDMNRLQTTLDSLRLEFEAGNITVEEYAAALKQAQRDAKNYNKFAKEIAIFSKEKLGNDNLSREFENISGIDDLDKMSAISTRKEEVKYDQPEIEKNEN